MVQVPQSSPKILIVQLRRIGDVVFTLPVAGVLARVFKNPIIDFLVEPPADVLVALDPHVRKTLSYDSSRPLDWIKKVRNERYDAVLDFHANGRTLWITTLSGAAVRAGFEGGLNRRFAYNVIAPRKPNRFIVDQKIDLIRALPGISRSNAGAANSNTGTDWDWKWDLHLPSEDRAKAKKILDGYGVNLAKGAGNGDNKKWIGFAPLHRHSIRAWHPDQFAQTADRLIQKGFGVILLGGPGEKKGLEAIQGLMKEMSAAHEAQSLMELSALISYCSGFLANDNGPQKIAMALNVPGLTVFGPTNPLTINLNRKPQLSIRDEKLFCIACEKKICPYKHECMTNVTVDAVLQKMAELFR